MKEGKSTLELSLDSIEEGLVLYIDARKDNTLFEVADAIEHGEAVYQLVEGCSYDYEFSNEEYCLEKSEVVTPHRRKPYCGTISPNIYVGTLELLVVNKLDAENRKPLFLEVRSIKADYRADYRDMLEYITEKCADVLMQVNSPVSHHFEPDFERDNKTLYQKFAFVRSIVSSDEFSESVHRIVTAPVTKWVETTEQKDVRNVRRFTNTNLKELAKGTNRMALPVGHSLRALGLKDIPTHIASSRKVDTVDTAENRFVKYVLESLLEFCSKINQKAKEGCTEGNDRLCRESDLLIRALEGHLHHSIFKEISHPDTLKLNSPVLQRKEGYREVLRVWLMFDLAARLVWRGGDDVYKAGKKNIATLYEYWLFFKLLDLFQELFSIEAKEISALIEPDKKNLSLKLKQGEHTALQGIYALGTRSLHVRFNYNRSFRGNSKKEEAGSWTATMRPDYTLSVWPVGIDEKQAEREELIVHIHFDAKYKIGKYINLLKQDEGAIEEQFSEEKSEQRKGVYNNDDLLKMHAYKDAIRRTGGAYVLYPGDKSTIKTGFHEVLPGLGAFPVRPRKGDDGIEELKGFVIEVIEHFMNRASQRENLAYRSYVIHKNPPQEEVKERMPEAYGNNRGLLPTETSVLVGYCNESQYNWIEKSGLYNARAGSSRGSLRLGPKEAGAKYLLLHSKGNPTTNKLLKITETGPRIFSRKTLLEKGYPSEPSQEYYLVYKVKAVDEEEFLDSEWDVSKLSGYASGRGSALPFAVSLTELMQVKE